MNRMQTVRLIAAAAGFASVLRAEIQPGDTKAKVVAELGDPNGSFLQGDREVFLYANGTVEFRDGKALKIALTSPEETAAREAEQAEARRVEEEARQASILEGGEKIRLILETERFKRMPPLEKVMTPMIDDGAAQTFDVDTRDFHTGQRGDAWQQLFLQPVYADSSCCSRGWQMSNPTKNPGER